MRVRDRIKYDKILKLCNENNTLSACIYLLKYKGEIIYIGKSVSLFNRLIAHWESKPIDEIEVLQFSSKCDMHIIEPYLISKFKPMLNRDMCHDESVASFEIDFTPDHSFIISRCNAVNRKGFLNRILPIRSRALVL